MTELEADRETYRAGVVESRKHVKAGDSTAANAAIDRLAPLLERWRDAGQLDALLTPLLTETEPVYVRLSAALGLLHRGYAELGEPALEKISSEGHGVASMDAKFALRSWRKQNA